MPTFFPFLLNHRAKFSRLCRVCYISSTNEQNDPTEKDAWDAPSALLLAETIWAYNKK